MDIREQIKNLLGLKSLPEGKKLDGFTDEQLQAADAKAREVFAAARESKDLEAAAAAHAVVTAIRDETSERIEATEKLEAELARLAEGIDVSDPEEGDPEGDGEGEGDGEDPEVVEAETPVVETPDPVVVETPATTPTPEPVPVAAAATPKPVVPKPSKAPEPVKLPVTITAGADVPDHSAGSSMDVSDLGPAYVSKSEAVRTGRIGGRNPVAKIKLSYPGERIFTDGADAWTNQGRIDEMVAEAQENTAQNLRDIMKAGKDGAQVLELSELTAAGGLCAPREVRYDICQQGDDHRPLRDSLIRVNARRGGLTHMTPPRLSDVDGSVQITTADEDATGYTYPKDCIRVDCGTPVTVDVSAISLCMEVGNFQRLSYGENFAAWWHYGQVLHARTAETELWDNMVSLSTARTANVMYGAARTLLSEVERYAAQLRYEYRIQPLAPLRLWLPEWVKTILRTDLANQLPGDQTLNVGDAQLVQYLASRGVAVTFVADGQDPGTGDTELPSTVTGILALEGTFLFLDMGELNFGTEIRDFTQIRQNDSGAFFEVFENVTAVCNGPQAIEFTLCPSGAVAPAGTLITCS